MRRIDRTWGALLVLVVSLVGCSGSNAIIEAPDAPPGDAELTRLLQRAVLPTLDKLAAFSPVNQPAPPGAGSSRDVAPECARYDLFCTSGGFEVCGDAPEGWVRFRYDRCARPVGAVDGTWELRQSGFDATATFELTVDSLSLAGEVGYQLDGLCWNDRFDGFSVAVSGYALTLDGSVGYCFASGARLGALEISVTGSSRGPYEVDLEFEGRQGVLILDGDDVARRCTLDLTDGDAHCDSR